jgi:hypothetical protein
VLAPQVVRGVARLVRDLNAPNGALSTLMRRGRSREYFVDLINRCLIELMLRTSPPTTESWRIHDFLDGFYIGNSIDLATQADFVGPEVNGVNK